MRLAALSDIHSDFIAFHLAINSLKNEHVDKLCFLGDYITDGENEVLSIVQNLADYAILGNRKKYILTYSPLKKRF